MEFLTPVLARIDNVALQAMWAQLDGTPEGLDELFALAVTL